MPIDLLTILQGDALERLRELPDASVQMCATSPPYWGLRDYGTGTWEGGDPACAHEPLHWDGPKQTQGAQSGHASKADRLSRKTCRCGAVRLDQQIGLEETPEAYVARLVEVFREVNRVLRDDGTLWLNLGDSYNAYNGNRGASASFQAASEEALPDLPPGNGLTCKGLKNKDLVGVPWMVAFALRADGWYLRQDIIWCLSGGAWVYARTQKGDMPVMVKDLVRLDPSTVQLWNGQRWTQVLGWSQSADTTERIELRLRSGERIGCTGSHEWPTQRGLLAARDLRAGDVVQTCRLPEPEQDRCPGYLTASLLWLIGLYLAEGSRAGDTVQLSLHADETRWLPAIQRAAESVGATMTHTLNGNGLAVRLYGRILRAVLDEYVGGATAIDKHLTTSVWRLSNANLRLIAEGYLNGDGGEDTKNGRVRLGFCRNYALERDLRVLAARLGATLTLNSCMATYQDGQKPAFKGEWRWFRSGHHNEKDRGEVVEIGRSRARKFWDIGVADDPHLFALASGVLTHNSKKNCMPESVTDRCTKSHEYVFLLSKAPRYYYDAEAIKEPVAPSQLGRVRDDVVGGNKGDLVHHSPGGQFVRARGGKSAFRGQGHFRDRDGGPANRDGRDMVDVGVEDNRNRRDVWTIGTKPYPEAHFAVWPEALVQPMILAGCPEGGVVLDPFAGSGTTGAVALKLGRRATLIELNPAYVALIKKRCRVTLGLPGLG